MTQPDLFGNEPPQTLLTLKVEDHLTTSSEPSTYVEVWSAGRHEQNRLLGVVVYEGTGHDLLPGFLGEVWLRWEYETLPGFRKWLKEQHDAARQWKNSHPAWAQDL